MLVQEGGGKLKKIIVVTLGVVTVLAVVSCAQAAPITILAESSTSEAGLGEFEAVLTYNATDNNNATLTVDIQNTSPAANGGYITAFALNNPFNLITGVSMTSTDSDFNCFFANNKIDGDPYGNFDIAASLGTNINSIFMGGGNPTIGIGIGVTETFTFSLIGYGLTALSEQRFVEALSDSPAKDKDGEFFLVRFRGFEDQNSDKVPGSVIPEPLSIYLLTPSLAALAFLRKKTI